MQVHSLGREDPLEESMTTHSHILAWRIPWTEESAGYSPYGHTELDTTQRLSTHTRIFITLSIQCVTGPVLSVRSIMINETRGTGFGATHSLAYRRGDRSCIKGQTQCAGRVCNREHSLCLGFMKARAGPASLRQREELTQWLSSARQRGSSRNQ